MSTREWDELKWRLHFLILSSFFSLPFDCGRCCCCCWFAPVVVLVLFYLILCAVAVDTWNGSVHTKKLRKKVAPPLAHCERAACACVCARVRCPVIFFSASRKAHFVHYIIVIRSLFVSVARNSIITIKCCLNLWLKLKYHPLTTTKNQREDEEKTIATTTENRFAS